ncbi:dCTP deaminase [Kitasatospora purpeofusca]|uniref:dCTP deaminase n=1 Tax=Kitasatospora purpeofusca TaxID=67352 RepID=UPI002254F8C8|nr:deoxycytidine deaminase [Kitasatospora purpeofusca]MCX4758696.1 deoxycytidine deaminase [Kitasatospora purpeofusca]WSR30870.1 deoxycytidine deaminase [Kitasatospora purpeofusca]
MILTGEAIRRFIGRGEIVFSPYDRAGVNPNSINYHLGRELKVFDDAAGTWTGVELPEDGFELEPHRMYLGHTEEVIGSSLFAMRLIGCSSNGRQGLFLQLSADLGHTTSCHRWTLEIVAALPMRIYPGMVAGQVSFWHNTGIIQPTPATYALFNHACETQPPMIGAPS